MFYEIDVFMETFDSKVQELILEKLDYDFRLNQMELYLGTMIQEMAIITRYQFLEESTQSSMQSYLAIKVIYTFKVRTKYITKLTIIFVL